MKPLLWNCPNEFALVLICNSVFLYMSSHKDHSFFNLCQSCFILLDIKCFSWAGPIRNNNNHKVNSSQRQICRCLCSMWQTEYKLETVLTWKIVMTHSNSKKQNKRMLNNFNRDWTHSSSVRVAAWSSSLSVLAIIKWSFLWNTFGD